MDQEQHWRDCYPQLMALKYEWESEGMSKKRAKKSIGPRPMTDPRLHFTATHSDEDSATFAVDADNGAFFEREKRRGKFLAVSVSEEKAVDSYNSMFECTFHLDEPQIAQLRDWLNEHFPK